jgi:hypothetical protein
VLPADVVHRLAEVGRLLVWVLDDFGGWVSGLVVGLCLGGKAVEVAYYNPESVL